MGAGYDREWTGQRNAHGMAIDGSWETEITVLEFMNCDALTASRNTIGYWELRLGPYRNSP